MPLLPLTLSPRRFTSQISVWSRIVAITIIPAGSLLNGIACGSGQAEAGIESRADTLSHAAKSLNAEDRRFVNDFQVMQGAGRRSNSDFFHELHSG